MLRKSPIGLAARRRTRVGGPRARGREAASVEAWAAIRRRVLARAGWRCQACAARQRLDVHHVVKRSQGGSDVDLEQLVALCRACHDQTDHPYRAGRLVITRGGRGTFVFERVWRPSKWDTVGETRERGPQGAHEVGRAARQP